MSRIRTVKPDFWTSEQVISCSLHARLLFIGLWNFCDDNGVHPGSYVRLKAEVFPGDSIAIDDIKRWVNELISHDLLREYFVEDKPFWIVTGWKKHQRIDKPTYKFPLPQSPLKAVAISSELPKLDDYSSNIPRGLDEESKNIPVMLDDSSITDRKGMDRNGKEKDICEAEASRLVISEPAHSDLLEIFIYWQTTMKHPRAKLDRKRKGKITAAFALGYTLEELKQAIDGCALTPWNMGHNERAQPYDDIELILRDASHIDRFIQNASNPPSKPFQKSEATCDLFTGAI